MGVNKNAGAMVRPNLGGGVMTTFWRLPSHESYYFLTVQLLDHADGLTGDSLRESKSHRFRRFHIDHQALFSRLQGQIAWFGALENLVGCYRPFSAWPLAQAQVFAISERRYWPDSRYYRVY